MWSSWGARGLVFSVTGLFDMGDATAPARAWLLDALTRGGGERLVQELREEFARNFSDNRATGRELILSPYTRLYIVRIAQQLLASDYARNSNQPSSRSGR